MDSKWLILANPIPASGSLGLNQLPESENPEPSSLLFLCSSLALLSLTLLSFAYLLLLLIPSPTAL